MQRDAAESNNLWKGRHTPPSRHGRARRRIAGMNEELNFEQALARLEAIGSALESGSAPLDESLAQFSEGVELVKRCKERLDDAERRIRVLIKNEDGTYDEQDFTGDPE